MNGDSLSYRLEVLQQPMRCRTCGSGEKDRRPVDPPPILKVTVSDEAGNAVHDSAVAPFLIVHATLWSPDMQSELTYAFNSRALLGSLVSSCHRLNDHHGAQGFFFIFHDLSVRNEGQFRLKFSLFNLQPDLLADSFSCGSVDDRSRPSGVSSSASSASSCSSGSATPPSLLSSSPTSSPRSRNAAGDAAPSSHRRRRRSSGRRTANTDDGPADLAVPLLALPTTTAIAAEGVTAVPASSSSSLSAQSRSKELLSATQLLQAHHGSGGSEDDNDHDDGDYEDQSFSAPSGMDDEDDMDAEQTFSFSDALVSVFSEIFTAYPAKRFPGMTESTELSKCLAQQGVKIPTRHEARKSSRRMRDVQKFVDAVVDSDL
ncbi:hypothetical protein RI367_002270 [Sorochytrium milnesiophthora]